MNIEEKTKLFAHFLFCEVKAGETIISMRTIDTNIGCVIGFDGAVQLPIEDCKLILKDLKNITREDAMRCAELANLPESLYRNWAVQTNMFDQAVFSFPEDDNNYRNMIIFAEDKLNWRQVDYLRSQGYNIGVPEECIEISKSK